MKSTKSVMWRLTAAVVALGLAMVSPVSPAGADPKGHEEITIGVGFFYGTFNQSPNIALLAGGNVQQFCEAGPEGDPGLAQARLFLRSDGSVDVKANGKNQPIYLYYIDFNDIFEWLDDVCPSGDPFAEPFASGTARLKVRTSVISENYVEVFNSVNGKATGTDGSSYKVRASADLVIQDGVPLGNPQDFVGFKLQKIKG